MRLALRMAVVVLALAVAALFYARYTVKRMFPPADRARIEALKSSGRPIVEAIEAHRRTHGRFPDELKSVGKAGSSASIAGWRYHTHEDGKGYHLTIGDYAADHFVLIWDSDNPQWTTDE